MFFIGAIVLMAFMFLPTFLLTLFFYKIRGDKHSDKNHIRDRAIITAWAGIVGFIIFCEPDASPFSPNEIE